MEVQFSAATRRDALAAMGTGMIDLLVIGGGITGAGIARDAAMRGYRTAVVDAGDFGRGTSSSSSRLIHGGLRYLEHGWLRLVFESSRERRILLRIAPHLVWPRRFVFPVHKGSRVRRWEISAAVWLYDLLAVFRNVGSHRLLTRKGVLRQEPLLRDSDLRGGAQYYDAQCDDSRLVLATVRSAHQHGALCASYARVTALEKADGRVRGAHVVDELTGRSVAVKARVVVNATGPWTDSLRRLDDPSAARLLRPTKGAHIAVPQERIGNEGAVTLTSPIDGRVMFILPWGDVTVVGTTDTDDDCSPDDVAATTEDVTYLLRSANALYPGARLQLDDVIAAWAGLRPLLHDGGEPAGAVPREHRIVESAAGLVTIAGGKLTTYRAMGAQVVDHVARRLHELDGRTVPLRARTDREPLPGGEVADIEQVVLEMVKEGMPGETAAHLARSYGSEATAVANIAASDRDLDRPLVPGGPWLRAEVVHHARREMALEVSDVLVRRTHVFHRRPRESLDVADDVGRLLAAELRWDEATASRSIQVYRGRVARMLKSFA